MRVFAGTSGYSYKEWKGPFYPSDLPDGEMLGYYATQLPAVEINNTFYRMPKSDLMVRWAELVPDRFRFVIKASRRITHQAQLVGTEETLGYLFRSIAHLGDHLGPVLFQTPPWLRRDLPRLRDFVAVLEPGARAVFDFGHRSWHDDEVYDLLRGAGAAACFADKDQAAAPALVSTADWGYLRLRRASYDDGELAAWAARIAEPGWSEVYAFFKHETGAAGPEMAMRFQALFA